MRINLLILFALFASCNQREGRSFIYEPQHDTLRAVSDTTPTVKDTIQAVQLQAGFDGDKINTGNTTPAELLHFAQSLIGVPYKYGSINPAEGFDCSGFITYVFSHFNIAVPRSSISFTNVEREINIAEAKPGDIILFTGTDSLIRHVGHMGIITSATNDEIAFIHSSSGKAHGVTITPLNKYYQGRYVKTIRIFKQNDNQAL